MKKSRLYLLIIGFILILAATTNPNQKQHRETVNEKLETYLKQYTNQAPRSGNNWEQIGKSIGSSFGMALLEPIVNTIISSDNYVVFSLTKADWNNESNIIGVGIFGKVFLSKKIDKTLQELIEETK